MGGDGADRLAGDRVGGGRAAAGRAGAGAGGGRPGEMVITPAQERHLQARAVPGHAFNRARREAFLNALAVTCNTKVAAATVRVGQTTLYRTRRNDPAFAQGWAEALRIGYERLEEQLLARALEATDPDEPGGYRPDPDGVAPEVERAAELPPLPRPHGAGAGAGGDAGAGAGGDAGTGAGGDAGTGAHAGTGADAGTGPADGRMWGGGRKPAAGLTRELQALPAAYQLALALLNRHRANGGGSPDATGRMGGRPARRMNTDEVDRLLLAKLDRHARLTGLAPPDPAPDPAHDPAHDPAAPTAGVPALPAPPAGNGP